MKNFYANRIWIYLLTLSCVYASCSQQNNKNANDANDPNKLCGTIAISGAFALYPLAVEWSEDFKKLHPDVRFDIQGGGAGKGMADALSGAVDIGMVSRGINEEEVKKGVFSIAVAKDAVVPTINANNPQLNSLLKKGLSQAQFKSLYMDGKPCTWNEFTGIAGSDKVLLFTRSDAAGAPETWANYLGGKQEDLKGTGVFGDPGLSEAIMKNPLGLGFNNINYVYDIKTRKPLPGILPLPIDVNGNGKIDPEEDFYETIDSLNLAVEQNRFPSPPARELYFVTKGKTSNPIVKAFLNWILSNGQEQVEKAGYVKLDAEIVRTESAKLNQ